MILASTLISDAKGSLNDDGGTRWKSSTMLGFLNYGQSEIVNAKENTNVITVAMAMVAGARQTIPVGGIAFIAVDSNTNGNAVTIVNKYDLDSFRPEWHADPQVLQIQNYCTAGAEDKTSFYVYPPSDGTGSIDVRYQANPAHVATVADAITIGDEYRTALLDYMLYRAYLVDTEEGSPQKASGYYQKFLAGIGQQMKADTTLSPNRNAPPMET